MKFHINIRITTGAARRFAPFLLVIGLSLPSIPVGAQNLLSNGDFDSDVSGWDAGSERFDWISDDGSSPSGNGCAEHGISTNNGGNSLASWNSQIPVSVDATYTLSASVKKPVGSVAVSAWFYIYFLDTNGDWLGEVLDTSYSGDLSDNGWHDDFSYEFTTSTSAGYTIGYIWVSIGTGTPSSGAADSVLRWDNIHLVGASNPPAPIFADDFESGGTTAWSGTFTAP